MTIQHEVVIDLNRPKRIVIPVTQEDSTRQVLLSLLNNGLPYNMFSDLASGEQLITMVEYRRADGTSGMYDTTSDGSPAVAISGTMASGKWIVHLDGVCFTVPGWTQINIRFMTESGKVLHTFGILADVYDTACPDESGGDPTKIESIADMKAAISELFSASMSEEAKNALLNLLAHVAYTDEHGQEYLDELEVELFRTADLVSISAVFDQGSAVIYDTDDLDTLKQYLTVTATYEDMSTREITTYTLSGTLTVGTSTITVSYGEKTATFNVTVTENPVKTGYIEVGTPSIENNVFTPSADGYIKTSEPFSPGNYSWAIRMKIKASTNNASYQDLIHSVNESNTATMTITVQKTTAANQHTLFLSNSNSSYNVVNGKAFNLTNGQTYYLEFYFDGTNTYGVRTSSNGSSWTTIATQTSTSKIKSGDYVGFARKLSSGAAYAGKIYLTDVKIWIDGELWWQAVAQ